MGCEWTDILDKGLIGCKRNCSGTRHIEQSVTMNPKCGVIWSIMNFSTAHIKIGQSTEPDACGLL